MTWLVALIAEIISSIFGRAATMQRETARITHGTTELPISNVDSIRERAKKSGLLGLVVVLLGGCATREVVVATLHPVDDTTKGFPRIAQHSVRVVIDGSETIGTLEPAGGYFVIHETDLRALLRR